MTNKVNITQFLFYFYSMQTTHSKYSCMGTLHDPLTHEVDGQLMRSWCRLQTDWQTTAHGVDQRESKHSVFLPLHTAALEYTPQTLCTA